MSDSTADSRKAGADSSPGRYPNRLDFYHLFWIFVLASLVGLLAETIVSFPVDGYWKDRAGLVWGPFSPIYGSGAAAFSLGLYELRDRHPALIFSVAAVIGATLEWAVGRSLEDMFGFVAWSYIDQPFCFDGYTSLGMAIIWGAAGFAWVRWGLPAALWLIDSATARAPRAARVVTALVVAFMAVDIAATLFAFNCWFERQSGLPIETPVQRLCADLFDDAFMERRFQTISMYPVLATRG